MINRAALTKKGRVGRRRRRKGKQGRGTAATDKPPVLGMIARGGQCFLRLCSVQPWITRVIQQGSTVNTDEYSIYARLPAWGYVHVTVNHCEGEYAHDADGDGVNEVHVNTMEGLWSLLRSWLRPHRGISQHFLPLYIGFFQAMHNIRQRGHSLLSPLLSLLLTSAP